MPRPPLEIGTWGNIPDPVQVSPGQYRAMTRYRDTDGVTRKVEARGPSKNKARQALEAKLRGRQTAVSREVMPATRLKDVVPIWWRELEDKGRAANTMARYRATVDHHILKAHGGVGELRLEECTTWRMDEFLQGIRRDHGPASAKVAKTVLTGILSVAARYEAIKSNPLREVSSIPTSRKEVRALSPADVRRLRRALGEWQAVEPVNGRQRRPDDLRDVVDVMLATGCRISEALALRWADVDMDAGKITINGAVISVSGQGVIRQEHPKSAGSVKTYTLDATTAAMLRGRWERMTEHGLIPQMVFPSSTGTLRDPSNYRKQWRKAREDIGFGWVTPHTFRKTVATRVADEVGLKAASEYLGHSGEAVTGRHYRAKAPDAADMTGALAGFWSDEKDGGA